MATHSSILAWRISWTEEPGGLQSMRSQRVRYNGVTDTFTSLFSDLVTVPQPKSGGSDLSPPPEPALAGGEGCLVRESGVCTAQGVTLAWSSERVAQGLAAAPPADCSRLSPCGCVNLPSFCRTAACVVIPLLEQWARLRLLCERLDRRPLFLDSPEPRNVWNVRFPVGAALACALPVKILQKAVNCNQIRVLLLDSWCLVLKILYQWKDDIKVMFPYFHPQFYSEEEWLKLCFEGCVWCVCVCVCVLHQYQASELICLFADMIECRG